MRLKPFLPFVVAAVAVLPTLRSVESLWADDDGAVEPRESIELFNGEAVPWLSHRFNLNRVSPRPLPVRPVAVEVGQCDADNVFVYIDPPYPWETRTKTRIYKNEMTPEQHAELLAVALLLPCPAMVSSYPNDAYNHALAHWRSFDFEASTRGGMRTERVWLNYPTPPTLHDARFVGGDKRERERVRRRVRNLLAGLDRAGPRERQALLDAVYNHHPKTEPDQ